MSVFLTPKVQGSHRRLEKEGQQENPPLRPPDPGGYGHGDGQYEKNAAERKNRLAERTRPDSSFVCHVLILS
jgi:hypothetical protein